MQGKKKDIYAPNENTKIKIANQLIESCYELNVNQHKIMRIIGSHITEKDTIYKIHYAEIARKLGIKTPRESYQYVCDCAKELLDKRIIFDRKGKVYSSWLASIEIMSDGYIELELSDKVHECLYNLKKEFTQYFLKNIFLFQNKYSQKIYDLLIQYDNTDYNKKRKVKQRRIDLEEFRWMLNIERKYKKVSHMKDRILIPCTKEISDYTDLNVDF